MNNYIIRASALSTLFDCPLRYYYQQILGLQSPRSAPAQLGTSLHRSTAAYDQSVLDGAPITSDDAAGVLVDALLEGETQWDDELSAKSAETIGLTLHSRYCADIAPTRKYAAVEKTCEALPIECGDVQLTLTGTTDRIRQTPDGLGISDLKSGKRAVGTDGRASTRGNSAQLGVYELLAEHAMGLPITAPAEIIGLQTTERTRIGTAEIHSARDRLIGTPGQPGLIELAARILDRGIFPPNPRSQLCAAKYCPGWGACKYHD